MLPSQSSHRQAFIDILANDIKNWSNDEAIPFYTAATRVLLKWLGYELDDITFIDGRDRGIDAWSATETSIDIFQIKTHDFTNEDLLDLHNFDGNGIRDLQNAKLLLLHDHAVNVNKKELKQLLYLRDSILHNRDLQDEQAEVSISLHLVILGNQLTPQAKDEFKVFEESNSQLCYVEGFKIPVRFHPSVYSI